MIRRLFALVRVVLFLAPALLIAVLSIAYLQGVFLTLLAPGAPVRLELKTPGGTVVATASSYVVSPLRRLALLYNVSLTAPNGKQILHLDQASVQASSLFSLTSGPYSVRLSGAHLFVTRLPSGRLDIQDYVPKSTGPPSEIAVAVNVHQLVVDFVDDSVRNSAPYQAVISSPHLKFTSRKGSWIVGAPLSIQGVGQVGAMVQYTAGQGASIDLSDLRLKADSPLALVNRFAPKLPIPKGLAVGPTTISGSASVDINSGQEAHPVGRLTFTTSRFGYGRTTGVAATGAIVGDGSQATFTVEALSHGARVGAKGLLVINKGQVGISAGIQAVAPDLTSAVRAAGIAAPAGLTAKSPRWVGRLQANTLGAISLDGRVTLQSATWRGDTVSEVSGQTILAGNVLQLESVTAKHGKTELTGDGQVNFKSQAVQALVGARHISIAEVRKLARYDSTQWGDFAGNFDASGAVAGTLSKPTVWFRAHGSGDYTPPTSAANDLKPLKVLALDVLGEFSDQALYAERIWLKTSAGTTWGDGRYDLNWQILTASFEGRGIDLGVATTQATGLASIRGNLFGKLAHLVGTGIIEGYDLNSATSPISSGPINLARSDWALSHDVLTLSKTQIIKGATLAEGELALNLKTNALSGTLDCPGLELADILGENYDGIVNIRIGPIAGTLDKPTATLKALGTGLIANGAPITSVLAVAQLTGEKVTVPTFKASLADGYLSATGAYDLQHGVGNVAGQVSGLNLTSLISALSPNKRLIVAGIAKGSFQAAIDSKGVTSATGSGSFDALEINGSPAGQGDWNLENLGTDWKGSLQIAYKDQFLGAENVDYNSATDALTGDLLVNGLQFQNLYSAVSPLLADSLSVDIQNRLLQTNGTFRIEAKVAGTTKAPLFAIPDFEANSLTYGGVGLGDFVASGTRSADTWTIQKATITDGAMNGDVSGVIDEDGDLKLDGEVHNFDLSKLQVFDPNGPPLQGLASTSFIASGPVGGPTIRASLDAEKLRASSEGTVLGLTLDEILVQPGNAVATGSLAYRGFVGDLTLDTPFDYPFTIAKTGELVADLQLKQRPLSNFAPYLTSIDPKRADGSVEGDLKLTGAPGRFALKGQVSVDAKRLGFLVPQSALGSSTAKPIALTTELTNTQVVASIDGTAVTIHAAGSGSLGGTFTADLVSPLDFLGEYLNGVQPGTNPTEPLDSRLNGSVVVNNLKIKENNSFADTNLSFSSDLGIAGPLHSPLISGSLDLLGLDSTLPTLTTGTGGESTFPIDPRFDIQGSIKGPAQVRTSLATIGLSGGGSLKGSLSSPNGLANLKVDKGSMRLPGGLVRLQQGGSVTASYNSELSGSPEAHVDVDLVGSTHVTALRSGDNLQRYDVTLSIRGDLLDPDHVAFTATSDPPDLSQDQILALLGRTDILTALGSGQSYGQTQQALTGVLVGYAIPTLLSPITTSLSTSLGLDYLSLEYDSFGETSLLAAKSLGGGFSIFLRRQISEPIPGFKLNFDYRLTYRPKFFTGSLSKFSFLIGADQDRPFKIGLEYSTRF